MKKSPFLFIYAVFGLGQACSQEAPASSIPTRVFQVLSESTVKQSDGSSVTFRQVVPPMVAPPQVQPAAVMRVPALTAEDEAALSQMQTQEAKMLSISASVQSNGFTVLRWTCGMSQRLHAVSNVDFRALTGLGSLETAHASYFLILSARPTDETLSDAEAQAAQVLPVNGSASFALVGGSFAVNAADEATTEAINAMEMLLDYYDAHRESLTAQYAQREAENAARELATRNAPPPPPHHSVIHFWPLQPAQRAAINEQVQREALIKAAAQQTAQTVKGGAQP